MKVNEAFILTDYIRLPLPPDPLHPLQWRRVGQWPRSLHGKLRICGLVRIELTFTPLPQVVYVCRTVGGWLVVHFPLHLGRRRLTGRKLTEAQCKEFDQLDGKDLLSLKRDDLESVLGKLKATALFNQLHQDDGVFWFKATCTPHSHSHSHPSQLFHVPSWHPLSPSRMHSVVVCRARPRGLPW
jgi:hypothetical protein